MILRKALAADAADIVSILEQVLAHHAELRPDIFVAQGSKFTTQEVEAIIANPDNVVFVLEETNKRVVAYVIAEIHTNPDENLAPHKTLFVEDLGIDTNYRNRGLGTWLMQKIESEALRLDCYNVCLRCWKPNEAERLYRRLGYTEQAIIFEKIIEEDHS